MVRKILILTASPNDATRLRTDKEMQKIQERLRHPSQRNRFEIIFKSARPDTLLDVIEDEMPEIVHFCGHGTEQGIVLESETGDRSRLIPTAVLNMLFRRTTKYVKCVLLNACHSEIHASAISEHIPYTIGMEGAILDRAAIAFAGAFYKDLGKGKSIDAAFQRGYVAAMLIDANEVPKLFRKDAPSFATKCRQLFQLFQLALIEFVRIASSPNRIVLLSVLAVCLALAIIFFSNQLSESPNPASELPKPEVPAEERVSSGARILFDIGAYKSEEAFNSAKEGASAFKSKNYDRAIRLFNEAIGQNANNPEPYIYRNNAIARQRVAEGNKKYALAVVVPVSSDRIEYRAEEVLRGVADAQTCFNTTDQQDCLPIQNGDLPKGNLLEIQIADDANEESTAEAVANKISADKEIVGVIGNYASNITINTLPTYKRGDIPIPVISPASTSSKIEAPSFFRTVTSTKLLGKKLSEYVAEKGVEKVFGFSDTLDEYSRTSSNDFSDALRNLKETKIDYENIALNESEQTINEEIKLILSNEKFASVIFPPSTLTRSFDSERESQNRIIETAREITAGSNNLFLGGSSLYNPDTKDEGSAYQNMVLPTPWLSEAFTSSESYAAVAASKWKGRISWATAGGYDAVQVFMSALASVDGASTDEEKNVDDSILAALPQQIESVFLPKEFTSGIELRFNNEHEPIREPVLVEVKRLSPNNYDFRMLPNQ